MQEVQVKLAPFPAVTYWNSLNYILDASLSMPLAIITLGSRTDLPGGRFVTRWCARRLPMLVLSWTGAVASHLKDASTKRFSAAALCVFLLQLSKYFFHSSVSISAASHCGYFPLICDSDFARWQMRHQWKFSASNTQSNLQHKTLHSLSLQQSGKIICYDATFIQDRNSSCNPLGQGPNFHCSFFKHSL